MLESQTTPGVVHRADDCSGSLKFVAVIRAASRDRGEVKPLEDETTTDVVTDTLLISDGVVEAGSGDTDALEVTLSEGNTVGDALSIGLVLTESDADRCGGVVTATLEDAMCDGSVVQLGDGDSVNVPVTLSEYVGDAEREGETGAVLDEDNVADLEDDIVVEGEAEHRESVTTGGYDETQLLLS